jgi:hypothetical protein
MRRMWGWFCRNKGDLGTICLRLACPNVAASLPLPLPDNEGLYK